MFGIFKKKDPVETLRLKREKLLKESFELSKIDRKASDKKMAEAEAVALEIEKWEQSRS
jgi:hypothetical protein